MGIYERKQREKEQRRNEILEAARSVFSKKGFTSATMEEIASQAELSPGTLYLYFKNKEELHTSLSIEVLKMMTEKILEVSEKDMPVREKMKQYTSALIEMYEHDSAMLINLFHLQSGESLTSLSDDVLKQIKKYSTISHRALSDVIRQGIKEGIYIDEHPVALADTLWASYAGIILWVDSKRILDGKKNFVRPTLETAFKIIGKGMVAQ